MVDHFINMTNNPDSGFFLNNLDLLIEKLKTLSKSQKPIYLFGVTFALLDLARSIKFDMKNLYIIETGGMKGRGKEIIREELHKKLNGAFNSDNIFFRIWNDRIIVSGLPSKRWLFPCPAVDAHYGKRYT